jgi:hypothetical protein
MYGPHSLNAVCWSSKMIPEQKFLIDVERKSRVES